MRVLIAAAAEWLSAHAAAKREELRLLELGTYARGHEEGRADALEQFGIEVQLYTPVGEDDEDDD